MGDVKCKAGGLKETLCRPAHWLDKQNGGCLTSSGGLFFCLTEIPSSLPREPRLPLLPSQAVFVRQRTRAAYVCSLPDSTPRITMQRYCFSALFVGKVVPIMHIVFFFYDTLISSEFDTTERLSDKHRQPQFPLSHAFCLLNSKQLYYAAVCSIAQKKQHVSTH